MAVSEAQNRKVLEANYNTCGPGCAHQDVAFARLQSTRIKDLADIARLVEAHPELWTALTDDLREQVQRPL